jgi:hypothetical protein
VRRGVLTLLLVAAVVPALLAGCGSGGGGDTKTTADADCPMSATAARATHRRLTAQARQSRSEAEIVLHELGTTTADTATDVSPDERDVFILVNDGGGVAGLRGTSGSKHVALTARRGCGAVAYLPHTGATGATFTKDGVETGGTGAVEGQ